LNFCLGIYHAINWVSEMQFDNVDFKFNSKIVLDAFNKDREDYAKFRYVILPPFL